MSHGPEAHARPETELAPAGMTIGRLGIWWLIGSEIILFGALIGVYLLLKHSHPEWEAIAHEHLNVWLGALNTVILLTSSFTVIKGLEAVHLGQRNMIKMWLSLTIFLALCFLNVKAYEYGIKFAHGIYPNTNMFFGFYFLMTGIHALHVIGGAVALGVLLVRGLKGQMPQFEHRVEICGLYWHFVDLVWIFLFPLLYLS